MRLAWVLVAMAARLAHANCEYGTKQLGAARGTPKVDGRLDDEVWQHACWISDFEQKGPVYGAKPTHPLKVAVALDHDTLYVAARMWSAGPADIADALTERDVTDQAERFIVSIDPTHTKRLAYSFAVTARGVRADWIHTDDSEGERDLSWNPVWIAKTDLLPDGWSVEMAIPLSQVHLPREPAERWGINFNWYLPRRNEDVFWRAVPKDRTAWASYFGELVALPPLHPGLNLELLPYVAARGSVDEAQVARPMHRALAGFEAGLDAKLRPLPGLTINATVNPDFAQVEADPAFVNLTAYEVELEEKRPFFVENNSQFHNYESNHFYSRRIGGLPSRLPTFDAIDLPTSVRILGAAAAGGYVAPRTSLVAVTAVTDETTANAIVAGRHRDLVVSPLTFWSAGRIEQQLNDTSVAGVTATFVQRALGGTGLEPLLDRTAFVTGANALIRTSDGEWELFPWLGISGVFGSAESITAVEQTSAHYFQRPDQTYLHLDTTARRLMGWNGGTYLTKREGLWTGDLGIGMESPSWELNDLGVLHQADGIALAGEFTRTQTTPTEHFYAWHVGASVNQEYTFGGQRKPATFGANIGATRPSFWSSVVQVGGTSSGDLPDLTRGGPLMHVGYATEAVWNVNSPSGRTKQLNTHIVFKSSPTLDSGVQAQFTLATRVTSALRLDFTPSVELLETKRQYLETVTSAGGGDDTYGARYLFGHLHRREAALQLRATLSLSPDLVITVYAQPFVSVGKYDQIGELARAGGADVRWYDQTFHGPALRTIADGTSAFTIAEPNYSVASLRSTAVLRWEFRPGSTLFIAWQQDRGGMPVSVAQPLHATVGDAFTQAAIHTLAIKLSYWFG
ncbi:hypothetical protein BH11MYX1_BH11MYX1_15580 [soil metagenome]